MKIVLFILLFKGEMVAAFGSSTLKFYDMGHIKIKISGRFLIVEHAGFNYFTIVMLLSMVLKKHFGGFVLGFVAYHRLVHNLIFTFIL